MFIDLVEVEAALDLARVLAPLQVLGPPPAPHQILVAQRAGDHNRVVVSVEVLRNLALVLAVTVEVVIANHTVLQNPVVAKVNLNLKVRVQVLVLV